jgi:hypothetical protein
MTIPFMNHTEPTLRLVAPEKVRLPVAVEIGGADDLPILVGHRVG